MHGDRDLSVNHPDPELDRGLMRPDKEQRRREREKDRREERDRRERERDDRDYDNNDGSRERLSHKGKSGHRAIDPGTEPLHDADEKFDMHPIASACEDKSSLKSTSITSKLTELRCKIF